MKGIVLLIAIAIAVAINVGLGHACHWLAGQFGYFGAPWYAYSAGICLVGLIFGKGTSK